MKERLKKYMEDHRLLEPTDRVLVAASAGVDSTVLCHLLKELEIDFGIAHCNFQLRGEESDGDERFVEKLASGFDAPFYVTRFDTEKMAGQEKKSIQIIARELRYKWLNDLVARENYQRLATAHHLDDNIETVLYNFTKGTGIKGMRGILPVRKDLIRPLLFCTKKEILAYAKMENIPFREDRSNNSTKYNRNKIRQQVVPVLESINPSFQKSAAETILHLMETEKLYEYALKEINKKILIRKDDETGRFQELKIHIDQLKKTPAPVTVLFEIIKDYGFNSTHSAQIVDSMENQAGSQFISGNYQLLIDRKYLIIREKDQPQTRILILEEMIGQNICFAGGELALSVSPGIPTIFEPTHQVAYLDADKIQWPLKIRNWKHGDVFHPFGMQGKRKKIQDLLTDLKLSRWEKEKVWVMESNGKVCWVLGIRSDERFKVTKKTVSCLMVKFLPTISS